MLEHISTIISRVLGATSCPDCDGNDKNDGPVPNEKDREMWIDLAGYYVECPMCEDGRVYWEDNWLAGGEHRWRANNADCEHCKGSGELRIHDRCGTCGRLEQAYGKGPERVDDDDRIRDHLEY